MNEIINEINKLNLKLDTFKEKLSIAIEGLKAIKTCELNGIATKTLEEIHRLDSND